MAPRPDAGFTLIESLVALAVLAVASVSLLLAVEAYVARIDGLEVRALAQLAAENEIAGIELGLPPDPGPVVLLGHRFGLDARAGPTADPDLERVDVEVTDLATQRRYGGFTAFVGAGPGP